MTIEVEGVYKKGKIVPLKKINLEENTKVLIKVSGKLKKKAFSLAGAWRDYRTIDGKNIDWLKKEIYESRKISTRRTVVF